MKKINIVIILVILVAAAMASGVLGSFLARMYLIKESFNLPLFNDLNFKQGNSGSPSLIITDPKKVVVEQDVKIQETLNSVKGSIAGIYKRTNTRINDEEALNINDYYLKSSQLGQAFILTSDGWLLSSYLPPELEVLASKKKDENFKKASENIAKSFAIITNEKKVYQADNIIYDDVLGLTLWHVVSVSLPVRQFASDESLKNGQQVIAVNNIGWVDSLRIIGRQRDDLIESSDLFIDELILDSGLNKNFNNSFFVNLNGDLAAILNKDGKIISSLSFANLMTGILRDKKIDRASLGINYILVSELANYPDNKGAVILRSKNSPAVEKNSPAEKVGLKEGNVLIEINGSEINENNSLNKILSRYKAGEEVEIKYIAGNDAKTSKIKLDSFSN